MFSKSMSRGGGCGCKGARGHGASSWHKCQLFYTERFTQSMLMIMTMMMTAKRGMPIELVTAMLKKIGKCVKGQQWGGGNGNKNQTWETSMELSNG